MMVTDAAEIMAEFELLREKHAEAAMAAGCGSEPPGWVAGRPRVTSRLDARLKAAAASSDRRCESEAGGTWRAPPAPSAAALFNGSAAPRRRGSPRGRSGSTAMPDPAGDRPGPPLRPSGRRAFLLNALSSYGQRALVGLSALVLTPILFGLSAPAASAPGA